MGKICSLPIRGSFLIFRIDNSLGKRPSIAPFRNVRISRFRNEKGIDRTEKGTVGISSVSYEMTILTLRLDRLNPRVGLDRF